LLNNFDDTTVINISWTGIPIIASNMDTTGTFEVYNFLKNYKILLYI
jgi:hypothetical protein